MATVAELRVGMEFYAVIGEHAIPMQVRELADAPDGSTLVYVWGAFAPLRMWLSDAIELT